jgi:predicted HTH transcriptional regulator
LPNKGALVAVCINILCVVAQTIIIICGINFNNSIMLDLFLIRTETELMQMVQRHTPRIIRPMGGDNNESASVDDDALSRASQKKRQRRSAIVRLLKKHSNMTASMIANRLRCNRGPVRSDLETLIDKQVVKLACVDGTWLYAINDSKN